MGASKKKSQAVAGPSKLKMPEPKPAGKTETKEATTNAGADKGKEKPKATGKLQFFSKPKEPVKAIKKEEPAADTKKKIFFSKPAPAAKAPATAKDVASTEPVAVKVENVEPSIAKKKAEPSVSNALTSEFARPLINYF
jgi:DNA polymerase delta subunit 3